MATALNTLSVPEFEARFGHEKPYYEYWYGEPIQKPIHTWTHGLLQRIIMDLLPAAGYKAASEVKLKLHPAFHPVPDIIATTGPIQPPYPTNPVDIVIEILSETDTMSRLLTKCAAYQSWGIPHIYLVDPTTRLVFRWSETALHQVTQIANQPTEPIWTALDQALA